MEKRLDEHPGSRGIVQCKTVCRCASSLRDISCCMNVIIMLVALLFRPTQSLMTAAPGPVTNPFGTLPAMPQMMIGRSAGSGPSVQYGISTMPVSPNLTKSDRVLPFTPVMNKFSLLNKGI